MHFWLQILIAVVLVALTAGLVPALLAHRRAMERIDRVLAAFEQELRPLSARAQALLDDLQLLARDARGEVAQVAALTERVREVSDGLGRVLGAVAGLTRAGQLVGVAAGIKTGVDVFLHRLRRHQGGNNE